MKIAIVTDIHHGPVSHTKTTDWQVLPRLEEFVAWANTSGAELLLDLGDHISDKDAASDRVHAAEVAAVLSEFRGERVHLAGNHDVVNLTPSENAAVFGQTMAGHVVDLGATRLIAWQPGVDFDEVSGFRPAAGSLPWLIEQLDADPRPAIIATHVPLSGHSQAGNYYFQNRPHLSTYPDHAAVRAAVEANGRAALWLSGHVHWNTLTTIGGIRHLTVQSFSERFTTAPETAMAHALLEIDGGTASLEVLGNDRLAVRMPFGRSGDRRWMAPRPEN